MKILRYIAVATMALMATSCEDFLDRSPITEPNSEDFLSSESQVCSFINGLYLGLPIYGTYGMGVISQEVNSDNIIATTYDLRLNGEASVFDGESKWSAAYQNLRDVNYFFEYYRVPEAEVTNEVRSMIGEAYFFRAYWHFELLKNFGDVPIMDGFWDSHATVEGLQIPQSSRAEVARFILQDLESAIEMLYSRSQYKGLRICKEAAMVFAMRVALFEGSWEKYHKDTPFSKEDNSNEFFGKVIELGDELFTYGITLNSKSDNSQGEGFGELFNSVDLSNVDEALFWKKYSLSSGLTHYLLASLSSGITVPSSAAGITSSLVNNYLYADGTPIDPADDKFKDFNQTFENRDGRLLQTVMHTGAAFKTNPTTGEKITMNVKERLSIEDQDKDILSPYLNGGGNQQNITGYHTRLCIDQNYTSGNSETALNFIRYAEALLAYAEAKEEMGECDDAVLEMTLKPLRERAGVKYIAPKSDSAAPDYGYAISDNMQEIRRERRSELALQGFRLDDILRWRAAQLITGQRFKGAYIGEDGVLYKSYKVEDATVESALKLIPVDSEGFIDPLRTALPSGYGFVSNRDYLMAIPVTDINLNKELTQNPNWN
ncbi:MAG: RagB/SusD family nutrient uptake outer membrane protein [Rikenellaceae bacterium]